jgi:hypothetical protein
MSNTNSDLINPTAILNENDESSHTSATTTTDQQQGPLSINSL